VPFFGDGFSEEREDCVGELFLAGVETVVGDVRVHDLPQPLNGVEMRAVGRQLDEVDAAVFSPEEGAHVRASVVGGVVPNHVDFALVGVARLDLGEQLHRALAIDGRGLDEGRIEGLEV